MKTFRIVVLGSGGVGKTSLVGRFVHGIFSYNYQPTLEDSYRHLVQLPDGIFYTVEILDTAGMHQFPAMRELSIQSGQAFVIVYSVESEESFKEALQLKDLVIKTKGCENIPMVIVGNKMDLAERKREIESEKAESEVRTDNCSHIETSARYDMNVQDVFMDIMVKAYGIRDKMEEQERRRSRRLSRRLSASLIPKVRRMSSSSRGDSMDDDEAPTSPQPAVDAPKCVIL